MVLFQGPFVLGWAITVHRSQSLTLSEPVLDIAGALGTGMITAAICRVGDRNRMHVQSIPGNSLLADSAAVKFHDDGTRL